MGSFRFIAACSVSSNCLLYLVVLSIVVLSHSILCSVVRDWWAGAYCICGRSQYGCGLTQVLSGLCVL